jgi:hypothetical protein
MGIDAEAKCWSGFPAWRAGRRVVFAVEDQEVGVEVEAALGDGFGVEGAQGAGGKVARVGGGGEAGGDALFVGFFEGGERHDDLSPQNFAKGRLAESMPDCLSFLTAEMPSGTLRMVRTLVVTSSPIWPSPRVRPRRR